ncbi:MAG: thioester reductase domain-containing protein [Pseudomonadota bacterium]
MNRPLSTTDRGWLRHDVITEPLIHQWYAWSYLLPPATAARYLTHAQLPVIRSFIESPEAHAEALRDPAMVGGPFIQHPPARVSDLARLLDDTVTSRAPLLALSAAIDEAEALLAAHPKGQSMDGLYARLPEMLRGFVELVCDGRHQPALRWHEGLLYRSSLNDTQGQSIALRSLPDTDRRAFVMSTPRLDDDMVLALKQPFAAPVLDQLFAARHTATPVGELAEALGLDTTQSRLLSSLFTDAAPPEATRFKEVGVRVRYMGHACVLVETAQVAILVDPLVSYAHRTGMPRFSLEDLPPFIDYALITHNHQDHVMLETLLQLRHRIGEVVVPGGHRGSLLDPSLRLALREIGFEHVRELDRLDELPIPGGRIVSLPVLGEHGDLDIASKTAWWIEAEGRSVLCAADSNNLDTALYRHLAQLMGPLDLLFIGMECEGAPYTWAYGPLLPQAVPHSHAQARRLNGSDADRGMGLIDSLRPAQVFVYAMGQEPWLNYITSIHYTPDSLAIIESDKLVARCRERGIDARRLLGCAAFHLAAANTQRPPVARRPRVEIALPAVGVNSPTAASLATHPAAAQQPSPTTSGTTVVSPSARSDDDLGRLLDQLIALGVQLSEREGKLLVQAPKGALGPELAAQLKTHKDGILRLISRRGAVPVTAEAQTATPLPTDALLPPAIRPEGTVAPAVPLSRARHILLTGATGFVGAFVLRELLQQTDATIHCLVRPDPAASSAEASDNTTAQGLARIEAALHRYGLWDASMASRLRAVPGDLARPELGLDKGLWQSLSETIDAIVHNGAHVHHMLPYERLRAANVQGTLDVIRLAMHHRLKPLHHVSSLSVLPPITQAGGARFEEDAPLPPTPVPTGGYNRSKWMAEHLVRQAAERGLPVAIYRPGPASGDSHSGAFNENDFLYRLMQGYIQSGLAPEGELPLDILPVDHLARSIVWLARQDDAAGACHHLLHPQPVSSDVLFAGCEAAGHRIRRVPYAQWFQTLQQIAANEPEHALYPLAALFASRAPSPAIADSEVARPAERPHGTPYDTHRSQARLQAAPFQSPVLDAALITTYLRAMAAAGVLPDPIHARPA